MSGSDFGDCGESEDTGDGGGYNARDDRGVIYPGDGFRVKRFRDEVAGTESLYLERYQQAVRVRQELMRSVITNLTGAVGRQRNLEALWRAFCVAVNAGISPHMLLLDLEDLAYSIEKESVPLLGAGYELVDVIETVDRQVVIREPDGDFSVIDDESHVDYWSAEEMATRIPGMRLAWKEDDDYEGEVPRYIEGPEAEG